MLPLHTLSFPNRPMKTQNCSESGLCVIIAAELYVLDIRLKIEYNGIITYFLNTDHNLCIKYYIYFRQMNRIKHI